jgi:hypothetical protein
MYSYLIMSKLDINKIYYLIVSPEEKIRVQSELKAHLELNK